LPQFTNIFVAGSRKIVCTQGYDEVGACGPSYLSGG